MAEELKVRASIDGVDQVEKGLKGIANAGKDLSADIQATTNNLKAFEAALKKSTNTKEIEFLSRAVTGLKAKLEVLNAEQNNFLKASGGVKKGANEAGQALINVGRVAQDSAFGFIGIANNLNPLLESFQRLRKETGSGALALRALGSSLIGAGGIGLALSAVTAILQFSSIGFEAWTRGMGGSKKALEENKKAAEEFAKSLDSARSAGISTGLQLQNYVNIARDQTKSIDVRNEALEKANKILGDHGEKLTLVNIATAAVTEQINKFTEATIQQALASKFADRAADLIIQQRQAAKQYGIELNKLNEIKKKTLTFENAQGVTVLTDAGKELVKQQRTVAEAATAYKNLRKEVTGITAELSAAQLASVTLFGGLDSPEKLTGIIAKIEAQLKKLKEEQPGLISEQAIADNVAQIKVLEAELDRLLGRTKKGGESVNDVLRKMRAEIELLNKEEIDFNIDKSKERVAAFLGAIKTLVLKFKKDPESDLIQGLITEGKIAKLGFVVKDGFLKLGKDARTALQNEFISAPVQIPIVPATSKDTDSNVFPQPTFGPALANLPNQQDLDTATMVGFLLSVGITKGMQDGINVGVAGLRMPELKALYTSAVQRLQQLESSLNSIISDTFANAFSAIAEGIGQALSGQSVTIGNIFTKFLEVIANGLSAIGKALIKYGVAKTIIENLKISGPAAIALGVGLEIFAAALKNSLKLQSFAVGGVSAGGTFLAGERGPELITAPAGTRITPASQTNSILGSGQNVRVEVVGKFDGRYITLANRYGEQALRRQN